MKYYISQNGTKQEIAKMVDSHLLNALAKNKSNLEAVQEKLKTNPTLEVYVAKRVKELQEIVEALREEVKKRNLL